LANPWVAAFAVINNETKYAVEVVPMVDDEGRNVAVVISKGT